MLIFAVALRNRLTCIVSFRSGDTLGSVVYVPCEVLKQRMQVLWICSCFKFHIASKIDRSLLLQFLSTTRRVFPGVLFNICPCLLVQAHVVVKHMFKFVF